MPTVIRRQEGTSTLTATVTNVTISSVIQSNSIVSISLRSSGGGTNLTSHLVTGILTSSTNLRLQRGSNTSNCIVSWQVLQFDHKVRVQIFEVSHTSATINTVVSSVDLGRSISYNSCRTSTTPTNGMRDITTRERLTTSTELRSNCYQADANMVIACHVIEFGAEVTVQQVDGTFATATTDITISAVTMANTWVLGSIFPNSAANCDSAMLNSRRLLNTTTVRLEAWTVYDWYDNTYVVSSSDTNVERGYNYSLAGTSSTISISVNKNASLANILGNQGCMCETVSTTESFADFACSIELLSDSEVKWTRESGANAFQVSWEVVQFAYSPTIRRLMLIT